METQTNLPAIIKPAFDLDAAADRIRTILGRSTSAIIEAGKELHRAKNHIGHGNWGDWLRREFSLSQRAAQLYMRAAEWAEGKSEIVSLLEPTGVYLLMNAPAAVESEIVERVHAAPRLERILTSQIRDMVRNEKQRRQARQRSKATGTKRSGSNTLGEAADLIRCALGDDLENVIALLRSASEQGAKLPELIQALADARGINHDDA
jgi:hypothetical protein